MSSETWGAIADHSSDAYFDFVYWHDWPNTLNELAKHRAPKRRPALTSTARIGARGLSEGKDDGAYGASLRTCGRRKARNEGNPCIMNPAWRPPTIRIEAPLGFRFVQLERASDRGALAQLRKHARSTSSRVRDNLKSLRASTSTGWRDQYHILTARASFGRLAAAASGTATRNSTRPLDVVTAWREPPFLYRALKPEGPDKALRLFDEASASRFPAPGRAAMRAGSLDSATWRDRSCASRSSEDREQVASRCELAAARVLLSLEQLLQRVQRRSIGELHFLHLRVILG